MAVYLSGGKSTFNLAYYMSKACKTYMLFSSVLDSLKLNKGMGFYATFVLIYAKLGQDNLLKMVR